MNKEQRALDSTADDLKTLAEAMGKPKTIIVEGVDAYYNAIEEEVDYPFQPHKDADQFVEVLEWLYAVGVAHIALSKNTQRDVVIEAVRLAKQLKEQT